MKHICFFNSTKFWGGGEKLHLEYAEKFDERDYHVTLAANKSGSLFSKGKQGNIHSFHVCISNFSFLNPFKLYRLRTFFRQNQIDTIFISTSQDAKCAGIAARMAGVKNIIYLRGLAVAIKPSVINKYILKKVFTHLLVNSEETGRKMKEKFSGGFPEEKIKVIYHGIDLKEFDNQKTEQLIETSDNEIIIGNAGRLTKQKGQEYLIDMASVLKKHNVKFRFVIAGTGELKETLELKIREKKLEKEVQLLGFVSDMKSFMSGLDIFALSSLWEGFGYVIVEAMAANIPVVAFNSSSNPEIIAEGETGYLVKEKEVQQFADKIIQLIKDKDLRTTMGIRARESVEARFNLDDRIQEIEEYING